MRRDEIRLSSFMLLSHETRRNSSDQFHVIATWLPDYRMGESGQSADVEGINFFSDSDSEEEN